MKSSNITKTCLTPTVINYLAENLPDAIFEDRKKLLERMRVDKRRKAADEIEAMSDEDYNYFVMNAL
jgi:hypothetical protein